MLTAVLVVVALLVGYVLGLLWQQTQPRLTADPSQRMQLWKAIVLLGYLLVATVLTGYAVYGLWAAEPLVAPDLAGEPKCSEPGEPFLASLNPEKVAVGSATEVMLRGCSFSPATKVKVNGTERNSTFADASHIRMAPTAADVAGPGTMIVAIYTAEKDYGSKSLRVVPAAFSWHLYPWDSWVITQEVQLLLMVLFTGAFGASVYALKSFADYLGQAKLSESWFTFYMVQPFEGAGIAFLLYLVIRGGFLGGTAADVKNPFGICAIAGLAGAFSDMAFAKLREVFETLFKPKDDRAGKIGAFKISTTTLPDAVHAVQYNQTLQASGGTAPLTWSVNPALPAALVLNAATGAIGGIPAAATAKAKYTFKVTDSAAASATAEIELTVT